MSELDPTPTIRVIAAVIRVQDRYLVCQRPLNKRHGGLWEFPGGKMQEGESRLEAAARELGEELRVMAVATGAHLHTAGDPGTRYAIEFVEVVISGSPQAVEHLKIGWRTVSEMARLTFAPADDAFIRACLLQTGQP